MLWPVFIAARGPRACHAFAFVQVRVLIACEANGPPTLLPRAGKWHIILTAPEKLHVKGFWQKRREVGLARIGEFSQRALLSSGRSNRCGASLKMLFNEMEEL